MEETLTQVALPRNDGGTVGTLVFGHILAMLLGHMDFHGPALGEPGVTGGAFIRLLTCDMNRTTNDSLD